MKLNNFLKTITIIEFIVLFIMGAIGIKVKSDIGNLIGILLFLLPPCMLLILTYKDTSTSPKKRCFAFSIFVFLIIVVVCATLNTFLF